jgi:hypothetical protein
MFPRDEFFANHDYLYRWQPRSARQAQPLAPARVVAER